MKFIFGVFIILSTIQISNAQTERDILSIKETDTLIMSYCKVLNETYFNRDMSITITDTLKNKLKRGDFYKVTQLTDRLSLLIREMTNDNHFYIGRNTPAHPSPIKSHSEPVPENKNGGYRELKIIDKSIGYIKWNEFIANEESFEKTIAALSICQWLQPSDI